MLNAGPILSVSERGLPFASICSSQDAPGIHMTADNSQGIRQAIRHLVELGHTRIAHIAGSPESPDGQIRLAAYQESMQDLNLPILDGYIEQSSFTRSFGYEATLRLLRLKDRPTAIIASNDELGVGACVAAREMGIDVPNEISVVGFDDTEMASLCFPPLSTVQQPIGEMASAAIRAVVRLAGGQNDVKSICFPTRLILRASTAPARQGALR
jgi:DNA-binding LacI/PurR family transcriptional regulator